MVRSLTRARKQTEEPNRADDTKAEAALTVE